MKKNLRYLRMTEIYNFKRFFTLPPINKKGDYFMKNKLFSIVTIFCLTVVLLFAGDFVRYKPEELSDPEKVAKDYVVTSNLKLLKKLNIKKLVIMECVGEFITSKETTKWTDTKTYTLGNFEFKETETWKSNLKFDKDFYTNTVDAVYEAIVELFEKHGIEIIRKEILAQNERYKDWNLKEEKEGRGYKGGIFRDTVKTTYQKVSTVGLGVFPGPIGMIKVCGEIAPITAELGADGFLQVHFKVDQGKRSAPVLSNFEILLTADLRSQKGGFKGHEKLRYDFYTQWANILSLKKGIESNTDFNKKRKDGKFDTAGYHTELLTMLFGIINGWDYAMSKALPDNQPIIRQEQTQPTAEESVTPAENPVENKIETPTEEKNTTDTGTTPDQPQ